MRNANVREVFNPDWADHLMYCFLWYIFVNKEKAKARYQLAVWSYIDPQSVAFQEGARQGGLVPH